MNIETWAPGTDDMTWISKALGVATHHCTPALLSQQNMTEKEKQRQSQKIFQSKNKENLVALLLI